MSNFFDDTVEQPNFFADTLGPQKPEQGGFGSDTLTALKQGALKVPSMLTGLADIPLGLMGADRPISRVATRLGELTGIEPAKWADALEQNYSSATKEGKQAINAAWEDPSTSALDVAKAYASNPRTTLLTAIQSVPSMAVGGLAAKGVGFLAGIASAPVRAAIGEGGVMAGQTMAEIDPSVDPRTAAAASLAVGAGGAAIGYGGAKLAQKAGVFDVDTILTGGTAKAGKAMPIYGRIPTAIVQEGLIEEAPQSALEVAARNIAEDKPITEGLARGTLEGALAGSTMGAFAGAIPRSNRPPPSAILAQEKIEDITATALATVEKDPADTVSVSTATESMTDEQSDAEARRIDYSQDQADAAKDLGRDFSKQPSVASFTPEKEPNERRVDAVQPIPPTVIRPDGIDPNAGLDNGDSPGIELGVEPRGIVATNDDQLGELPAGVDANALTPNPVTNSMTNPIVMTSQNEQNGANSGLQADSVTSQADKPPYEFTQNKAGNVTVLGDPSEIRASFTGLKGVTIFADGKPTGIMFGLTDSPAVLAKIEGAQQVNSDYLKKLDIDNVLTGMTVKDVQHGRIDWNGQQIPIAQALAMAETMRNDPDLQQGSIDLRNAIKSQVKSNQPQEKPNGATPAQTLETKEKGQAAPAAAAERKKLITTPVSQRPPEAKAGVAKAVTPSANKSVVAFDSDLLSQAVKDTNAAPGLVQVDMDGDAQGVSPGLLRNLDRSLERGFYSEDENSKAWAGTREMIRQKHGDVVTLYRADTPTDKQNTQTKTVYMADEATAKKFENNGRTVQPYQVRVDDILAVYARPSGYFEAIVRKPQAAPAISAIDEAPSRKTLITTPVSQREGSQRTEVEAPVVEVPNKLQKEIDRFRGISSHSLNSETSGLKIGSDATGVAVLDTKSLRNIVESDAFQNQGLRNLDIPTQRFVLNSVLGAIGDPKVLNRVVQLIPVDMVNNLTGKQFPANELLNNPSVLKESISSFIANPIAVRLNAASALTQSIARLTAPRGSVELTGSPLKFGSAETTIDGKHVVTPSSNDVPGAGSASTQPAPPTVSKNSSGVNPRSPEADHQAAKEDVTRRRAEQLPWKQTRSEFTQNQSPEHLEKVGDAHRASVAWAVENGKNVPERVLADYPELMPKQTTEEAAQKAYDKEGNKNLKEMRASEAAYDILLEDASQKIEAMAARANGESIADVKKRGEDFANKNKSFSNEDYTTALFKDSTKAGPALKLLDSVFTDSEKIAQKVSTEQARGQRDIGDAPAEPVSEVKPDRIPKEIIDLGFKLLPSPEADHQAAKEEVARRRAENAPNQRDINMERSARLEALGAFKRKTSSQNKAGSIPAEKQDAVKEAFAAIDRAESEHNSLNLDSNPKEWQASVDALLTKAEEAIAATVPAEPSVENKQVKDLSASELLRAAADKMDAEKAKPAGKIEAANTGNAGEELSYNKRNRIKTGIKWGDIANKDDALRVRETTKQNVYPKPNYQAMVDDGMQPVIAHIVKQAYDSIATTPSIGSKAATDEHLQAYITGVNRYMDGVMAWANSPTQTRAWITRMAGRAGVLSGAVNGVSTSLSSLTEKTDKSLLEMVYPDGWRSQENEVRILGGNKALSALQPGMSDAMKATKEVGKGWPSKQEAWQRQGYTIVAGNDLEVRFYDGDHSHTQGKTAEPYTTVWIRTKNGVSVTQKSFDGAPDVARAQAKEWSDEWLNAMSGKHILLDKRHYNKGAFNTLEAAQEKARELTKREVQSGKIDDKGISVESANRTGVEHRLDGEDISSDQLKDAFGFKGVNFGTWMLGESPSKIAERQLHLNHAYDSFMDLAEVLGVPPKALSLDGLLGLAIGAQGSGQYAAHFVPGVNEINLTRTSGAGSLAHEFGHALDHYFARQADLTRQADAFLTAHMKDVDADGYTKRAGQKVKAFGDGIRPEIVAAFNDIVKAMTERKMTLEEYNADRKASLDKSTKWANNWLASIRRDFVTASNALGGEFPVAIMAKFDALAERINKIDLGEGKVSAGKGIAMSPVVSEIRDLYKKIAGKTYSIDQIKGLQANIDAMAFKAESLAAGDEHFPNQDVPSHYLESARALDKSKTKLYWSTRLEMFARAFDAYVSDALDAKSAKNTYLSHDGRSGETVPAGTERTAINAGIKKLIDTIQTKETDKGTAMFSRSSLQDDEFWNKIKQGESFTKQELIDAYSIGRRGTTRTSAGISGTGDRKQQEAAVALASWREKIAGFSAYRTVGIATPDGAFTMGVIPESLFEGTSLQAIDRTAIVRYRFEPVGGGFRLSIIDADYQGNAFHELAASGELKPTKYTDEAKDPYFKIDIGGTASKALLQESVRRLALHIGEIPTVYQAGRDTGARAGTTEERIFGPDFVEAKFSRTWRSALADSIEALNVKAQHQEGWRAQIQGLVNKGTVKADEVEWSGINDFLKLQTGKVTKEQVSEFLAQNGVQVEETTLGVVDEVEIEAFMNDEAGEGYTRADAIEYLNQDEGATPTKYANYQLPGGENYREVLLTLPRPDSNELWREGLKQKHHAGIDSAALETRKAEDAFGVMSKERADAAEKERALRNEYQRELTSTAEQQYKPSVYRSSHWDQPNVLAHIRLNDRVDADGNKVLFVEEIQSDWGQAGKKHGFKTPDRLIDGHDYQYWSDKTDELWGAGAYAGTPTEAAWKIAVANRNALQGKPDEVVVAPFVTKTDAWVSLALKRIIKLAVDEGYDKVAFINGEQSADRYSLDKHVGSVTYTPDVNGGTLVATDKENKSFVISETNVAPDKLTDFVGKDVAEKLLAAPLKDGSQTLRGDGLKVPQGGMRAFYDQIVPAVAKDVLRKLGGGKMETVRLKVPAEGYPGLPKGVSGEHRINQPSFTITPAMREKASGGLPLFARGDTIQSGTFKTNEANREKTDKLQRVLHEQGDDFAITPVSLPVNDNSDAPGRQSGTSPSNHFTLAERIARIFGKEVVWITAKGSFSINGVVVPGGGLSKFIFVNVNAAHPAHVVLGHELTHHMEKEAPGVYKALVKAIEGLLKNHEGYRARYNIEGASDEDVVKEMIGDLMGDNFDKREFWNRVSQESNGTYFKMIVNNVTKWLTDLLNKLKLRGLGSHAFTTDVAEARNVLAKAIADYAKTKGTPALMNDGSVAPMFARVYHGSPYRFLKFDPSKIGTGEGAQAYGHGLYLGGVREVGQEYAKANMGRTKALDGFLDSLPPGAQTDAYNLLQSKLRGPVGEARLDAIQSSLSPAQFQQLKQMYSSEGNLYTVDLPDEHIAKMLDWDKPLSQQAPEVQAAWARSRGVTPEQNAQMMRMDPDKFDKTGAQIMQERATDSHSRALRADDLRKIGIPGIRYLDGGSRGKGEGSYNYVIFPGSEHILTILDVNGEAVTGAEKDAVIAEHTPVTSEKDVVGKSGVLSADGSFKSWPKTRSWNRAEYNDVVSLLPEDYRNDPHRREPLPTKDWDALDATAVLEIDALNATVGEGTFRIDDLGNILADARKNDATFFIDEAIRIADKHGLGIYITGLKTESIQTLRDLGFDTELGLAPIVQREAERQTPVTSPLSKRSNAWAQPPVKHPDNVYGNPAYGTVMSYKPRGFSKALFSRSAVTRQSTPQAWQSMDASKMDDFIYSIQDKHIDTKRVMQSVRAAIGAIADQQDPYLQEELFHGRAAMAVKEFLEKQVRPLITDLQARGVAMSDFEEYLHARHAEEANAVIAARNPNMPDGGSGMDTQDARDYLAGLDPAKKHAYEALAQRVDAITGDTRQILVDYGLESQDTIDEWKSAYKNYVPLHREDMGGGPGIGQGFSVRGPASKMRTGSSRKVVNIIANVALQREKNIVRGEKNRVALALYRLAKDNPNPDFWSLAKPGVTTKISAETGDPVDVIDMSYQGQDNVVMSRMPDKSGKIVQHGVEFNERDERAMRMAKALKNLDADQLGQVMGTVAKMTRYFAAINTQYNPVFGVTNITRDVQTAMLNLQSTALKGKQKDVLKNILPALRGIYIDLRDHRQGKQPSSAYAKVFEEFQREGGATGYRDMYANAEERADAIKAEIDGINAGKLKQAGKAVMGWLSDYNEAMENAVRVSAYMAAKEHGMSNQQSASLAKNLTVNFNRKGQVALQAGALYAFFNASVQGSARMGQTLFEGGKLSQVGKQIITGGLLLGGMQAMLLATAGFDDDEPPDFVRERNLVIPIGGKKYITIPMPLGFHIIPNLSRIPTEWAMGGFKNTPKRIGQLVGLLADGLNPIGSSTAIQTLSPTIIDPFVALSENKDWTGKPIAKKDFDSMHPTAGHTRAKDTATPWAKFLSKATNYATGGTEYKPGVLSPTPDQIDYVVGQLTGGVGREIGKIAQVGGASIQGDEIPLYKIPLVGRFVGTTEGQAAESSRFYENLKEIGAHKAEIDGLKRDRKGGEIGAYVRDNPEARMLPMASKFQEEVSKLNHRKRELIKQEASAERIKIINMQLTARMKQFNDQVQRMKEAESAK